MTSSIADRVIRVTAAAMVMPRAVAVGITLGTIAGVRPYTGTDAFATIVALIGMATPNFWLATLFILLGSLVWTWLPVLDYVPFREDPMGNITSMLIPGFVLGLASLAFVLRMTRSSVLENMRMDYVRTARAKGLPEQVVFMLHITKNSLIPVVTVIGSVGEVAELPAPSWLTTWMLRTPSASAASVNCKPGPPVPVSTGEPST